MQKSVFQITGVSLIQGYNRYLSFAFFISALISLGFIMLSEHESSAVKDMAEIPFQNIIYRASKKAEEMLGFFFLVYEVSKLTWED